MNCSCGDTARFFVGRDGKAGYGCPYHKCKFYAVTPIQCDGYHRIMPNAQTPQETVIVRFEALSHPQSTADTPVMAVLATFQGNLYGREEVVRVLHDTQFEGAWHPVKEAYLYPDWVYPRIVTALRRVQHVLVEEVPPFFFRCLTRMQQVVTQHSEAVSAGTALTVDPEDAVYAQLKPFQKRGVDFVVAHDGRGLIADDMGLGKTVQAIAVAHLYRQEWPVLVMCPMSLMENWMKEFNKFAGVPYSRMVVLQGTKARATDLHDVVIVSYSSLKCLDSVTFNVVIADESHYIKTGEAKRAQQALRLCRAARRVVLLSGTPAMARPLELYTQLQALQPSIVPSKTQYGARYCNSHVSRFGVDMSGHSHTDELSVLLRHFMIRRTKKELGNELPSKTRQLLYVYITEKEKKALEKQVLALRKSIANHPDGVGHQGGGDYTSRAPNAFELKIATAQAKIPAVRDYVMSTVEQHLDSGEKIIFFAHHQCMMEALRFAVEAVRPKRPIDYIFIAGDTPAAQREQLANHFRTEPSCGVAVLSMQSSGTGHNFTCASTVVFAELDWNPSTHLQCEDRVHRIGQDNPCSIKYLLADGTSDSVIWPMLQVKLSVTSAMFAAHGSDGDAAGPLQLSATSHLQKVTRRDISENPESTQGTLDGFLKPSPLRSAPASSTTTPSSTATAEPRGTAMSGEGGVAADADRTFVTSSPPSMLTPPSRGAGLSGAQPSPQPVAPRTPVKSLDVLVPIEEYDRQRLAKAATITALRTGAMTAATGTSVAPTLTAHKSVEPKTSVLDLLRTSPATHASDALPISQPRRVAAPNGASGTNSGGGGWGGAPWPERKATPAATASASLAEAPHALPVQVASLLVATSPVSAAPTHINNLNSNGPSRTRTTFSFTKGPVAAAAGAPPPSPDAQRAVSAVTAASTISSTHMPPSPLTHAPAPAVAAHAVVTTLPQRSAPPSTATATTTTVARVSISVGFKRRHHQDAGEQPPAPLAAPSTGRGPRLEPTHMMGTDASVVIAPVPAPVPAPTPAPPQVASVETSAVSASPSIVFDPVHLSATVTTKPRTTFVFRPQKPPLG